MDMILSEKQEYIGEYVEVTCSTWNLVASTCKKALHLLISFSPVLWIVFFLILAAVTNLLEEV